MRSGGGEIVKAAELAVRLPFGLGRLFFPTKTDHLITEKRATSSPGLWAACPKVQAL